MNTSLTITIAVVVVLLIAYWFAFQGLFLASGVLVVASLIVGASVRAWSNKQAN